MKFKQYINIEEQTILNFIEGNKDIKLKKIYNQGYSRFDFTFTSGTTENPFHISGICEVKTRHMKSNEYVKGGVMIELGKLNSIMQVVAECKNQPRNINEDIRGFYLSSYDDKSFLFDLSQCNLGQIHFIKCPKTTAKDGNNNWTTKPVIFLNIKDSII